MAGNIDSEIAQSLNQSPNFRTAGANLRCHFRSANHDGSVCDEKAHNTSQTGIALRRNFLRRRRSHTRTSVCGGFFNAGIMMDAPRNSNPPSKTNG
jgi:hypothetical protein